MKYNNIIFDLDGTLVNSKEGVFNSLRYALGKMKYDIPEQLPEEFIGPPLQKSFKEIYGMNERNTELAIQYFREYYGVHGIYQSLPFDGMEEMLAALVENGAKLFVATSKLEKYAWEVIKHIEFDKYFDDLKGADAQGHHTKAELIDKIMIDYRLQPEDTVMIGDTKFDLKGAWEVGIASIAVNYGFGKKEELEAESPDYIVEDVAELTELLVG